MIENYSEAEVAGAATSILEGLLMSLGYNAPLMELSSRIDRVLSKLRGNQPKNEKESEKTNPDCLLAIAEKDKKQRDYVINRLHDQICELEGLIGS